MNYPLKFSITLRYGKIKTGRYSSVEGDSSPTYILSIYFSTVNLNCSMAISNMMIKTKLTYGMGFQTREKSMDNPNNLPL